MANNQAWNADLYADKHAFVFNLGQGVVDLLDPQPGEHILDVGCGTGQLTAQLAESVGPEGKVVGIDNSPAMINSALASYPGMDFRVMDVTAMPFDTEFDAVFSNAVLHWVPNADLAVKRIAQSLRPGGRCVAEFGGHRNVGTIVDCTIKAFLDAGALTAKHGWFYPSIAEYAPILEGNGLELQQAFLFDRPTKLEGEDGMMNWLTMFGSAIEADLAEGQRAAACEAACEAMRPTLYRCGQWYADYRRIRVFARKL
ncbi:MAG: class I SAM-dependent methyltransferase [Fimbriimonadaceae bacterium]